MESTSDPGRHNHCGIDLARKALLFPRGNTTYHLGVIGLCEAVLRYVAKRGGAASDLVTSYPLWELSKRKLVYSKPKFTITVDSLHRAPRHSAGGGPAAAARHDVLLQRKLALCQQSPPLAPAASFSDGIVRSD